MKHRRPSATTAAPTRRPAGHVRRALALAVRAALALAVAGAIAVLAIDAAVERIGSSGIVPLTAATGPVDCIIVPGALVYDSKTPSPMLQDRLDVALQLYRAGLTDRFLVSGDHGTRGYDEVNAMRHYLLQQGVPAEHIFMDHAGFDTYDTLYRARDVFGVRRAIVVTQAFHLKRALYIGHDLGLQLQGVASDVRRYPRAEYYRLREYLARSKAFLEGTVLRMKPTYLGDPIPITGNGLATLD